MDLDSIKCQENLCLKKKKNSPTLIVQDASEAPYDLFIAYSETPNFWQWSH